MNTVFKLKMKNVKNQKPQNLILYRVVKRVLALPFFLIMAIVILTVMLIKWTIFFFQYEGKKNTPLICPHCGKYKRMQGNGIIHQLCECGSEAEVCDNPEWLKVNLKAMGETHCPECEKLL